MNDQAAIVFGVWLCVMGCAFLFTIPMLIGWWRINVKAGKPGWACLIPIYNIVVLIEIAEKPMWWIAMLFVPIANLVFTIMIWMAVAQRFGRSEAFGLGLAFLGVIFIPILGFGSAQYTPSRTPQQFGQYGGPGQGGWQ
jgi:hypothetical protein